MGTIVSIIIVNYKTKDLTLQCIDSIFQWTSGVNYEIILVDNHSEDDSVKEIRETYPNIKVIENNENLGFGRANNIGAKVAIGRYLFLLNSDTILVENVVKSFYDFMESHPEYASCGCNLINAKGENVPTHGCLPSFTQELVDCCRFRFLDNYYKNKLSLAQTIDCGDTNNPGYIAGADIFIRASVFTQLGGFDPNIFMYFEETDLYARMKKRSLKSCLLPNYKIIHLVGGSSSANMLDIQRAKMFEKSRYYYYRKNKSGLYAKMVKLIKMIFLLLSFHNYDRWKMMKLLLDI